MASIKQPMIEQIRSLLYVNEGGDRYKEIASITVGEFSEIAKELNSRIEILTVNPLSSHQAKIDIFQDSDTIEVRLFMTGWSVCYASQLVTYTFLIEYVSGLTGHELLKVNDNLAVATYYDDCQDKCGNRIIGRQVLKFLRLDPN